MNLSKGNREELALVTVSLMVCLCFVVGSWLKPKPAVVQVAEPQSVMGEPANPSVVDLPFFKNRLSEVRFLNYKERLFYCEKMGFDFRMCLDLESFPYQDNSWKKWSLKDWLAKTQDYSLAQLLFLYDWDFKR